MKVPPPLQTIVTGSLMYGVSILFPLKLYEMPITHPAVMMIAGLGLWLIFPAVYSFWRAKTTVNPINPESASTLVVKGHYRFSRNPMYLGMACILMAWCVFLANPLNLGLLWGFLVVMTKIQIIPEEIALRSLFGESFDEYCSQVRRWI